MRIHELFESKLPDIVYHGTPSANLSNVMKVGLKPKLNKWLYSNNYQHSGAGRYKLEPGETLKDLADLSTTTSLDRAIEYAKQGGSTGWGNVPGAVVAFKPLPTDIIEFGGYDGEEIVFKNAIAPERLEIVWPEKLTSKKDLLIKKGMEKKEFGANKTAQIKDVNKQLKAAGSGFRIKSLSSNTPRVAIIFSSTTPLSYFDNYSKQTTYSEGPWHPTNANIGSPEFDRFLQRELTEPFTTTEYLKMVSYAETAFPRNSG